jgi:hypothetical protein
VPPEAEGGQGQADCMCTDCWSCTKTCGNTCVCTKTCLGSCVCTGAAPCTYKTYHSDNCSRELEGLSTLKAELIRKLAEIEEEEKKLAESMSPQTLEEAEMLEKKLTEALDEVKTMKAKFKKQPKKQPKK